MRLKRTENTKRNIIVGEIDKITGILLPFAVRTMIIHLIGADYLGLTGLFYSIIQMLNLAELGFGTAIIYSMYKPIAENDTRAINGLLRYYARVYRVVGVIIGAVGLVIMLFLPRLISGSIPPGINIYLLYLIFLGDSVANCFLYPNRKALLTAYQRNDVIGRMHIITQTAMYLIQMVSILQARNFYLYALTVPVSTAAFSLLCARQTRILFPEYREEGSLDPDTEKNIRKQVIGLMVRKTASLSRNAFDSMFISAYLGLSATAVYGNYYYVMDSVVMILAVVKTSMAGGVGNSIALESKEKNLADMHTIDFLFMWISGWCAVCLLCLYQPFMELWAGGDMMLPMSCVLLFSVYFYVLKMSDIRTLYAESVGIWWEARYLSVAEAASNLLLNWLFIRALGLPGILLATLISYLVFNFAGGSLILFRYYFTEGGLKDYMLSHLKYLLVTAAAAALTFAAGTLVPFHGLPELLIKGILCIFLPGAFYLLLYGRSRSFREAMPRLYILFHLKRKGS